VETEEKFPEKSCMWRVVEPGGKMVFIYQGKLFGAYGTSNQ